VAEARALPGVPAPALRRPLHLGAAGALPGLTLTYLTLLVVLPVGALIATGATSGFVGAITAPQAASALKLTVLLSLAAAAIDVVTGIALAWVLVRDEFPGKRLVNALIDLPFALPTIVAGLVLLALYGPNSPVGLDVTNTRIAVLLALLFVTLPFVVRAVQPVLISLDRDAEDAAASLGAGPLTTFRRIILPALTPAVLSGAGLSFAHALGEFGSVVLISGNLPFKTQVASVLISGQVESGDPHGAAAVSVVLVALALIVLAGIQLLSRRAVRRG
jgi:sulfate transport system permease protein